MTGIPPHPNIVNALGYTFKGKTLSLLQTLAHHYSFINSLNLFSYCSHYIIFMKTLVCAGFLVPGCGHWQCTEFLKHLCGVWCVRVYVCVRARVCVCVCVCSVCVVAVM